MLAEAQIQALQAAFDSIRKRAPGVTPDAFVAAAAWCDVHPVTVDGAVVGAVLVKGPEIHACVAESARGRWLTRRVLGILRGVIEQHGKAITRATTQEGAAFVKRLGFLPVGGLWIKEARHGL